MLLPFDARLQEVALRFAQRVMAISRVVWRADENNWRGRSVKFLWRVMRVCPLTIG